MKTRNYNMELMIPMQIDKEILFNESLSMIDNFCNFTITSFIDTAPSIVALEDKYIINSGNNRNYIYYANHATQGWQFLKPQKNMLLFVQQTNSFYVFNDDNWQSVSTNSSVSFNNSLPTSNINNFNHVNEEERFTGISGTYEIPADREYLYLYLSEDCQVDLSRLSLREVKIILKQHYQRVNTIQWPTNILWLNNTAHQLTRIPNSIDVIRFYRLIETNHYIGEVVGQDYKF
ncbi:MAG: DUF2793 domain-containing protein [Rickettsiaceae bacterium]|nr:MAG: DUF2793 domain-containing protein [Rickettsiaceae bacterium]